jgi:hypothetical protein
MSLQTILNWLLSNLQLLVVVGIFVLPVLGKIWGNVQKARALRAARVRAEQERIEHLRTGRANDTARVLQPIRVEPIQRREAATPQMPAPASRSAPGPVASNGARMRQIRLPGGIVIEVPDETPAAQSSSQKTQQPQRASQRPKKQKQPARVQKSGESTIATTNREAREAATADSDAMMRAAYGSAELGASAYGQAGKLQSDTPTSTATRAARALGPRSALVGLLGPDATREDVRRAFVMSEILAKPKAAE